MGSLEGRVAIVTGASRGIGQAIARRFATGGAAVAITARTAEEGQHRLAGSLATTAAEIPIMERGLERTAWNVPSRISPTPSGRSGMIPAGACAGGVQGCCCPPQGRAGSGVLGAAGGGAGAAGL